MRPGMLALMAFLLGSAPQALAGGAPDRPEVVTVDDVGGAAALLSRFAPGRMSLEEPVFRALHVLTESGTPSEVSLLGDVARHEQDVIANLARSAIVRIRERQREAQREAWAAPTPSTLREAHRAWRSKGLGPTEASCAAYAETVLGNRPLLHESVEGHPELLLAEGKARAAIAALTPEDPVLLAARAHEEAGDVAGALRVLARRAVTGDEEATAALDAYGLDTERLLLGLPHTDEVDDSAALELLVRRGSHLTVQVLAERSKRPSASEQAISADALGRMLIPALRSSPLASRDRELARKTLRRVAMAGAPPVRPIALEALAGE